MTFLVERRQNWSRIIGVERRGAPLDTLCGHPLPDPTRLVDEDFNEAQPPSRQTSGARRRGRPVRISRSVRFARGHAPARSDIRLMLRRRNAQGR